MSVGLTSQSSVVRSTIGSSDSTRVSTLDSETRPHARNEVTFGRDIRRSFDGPTESMSITFSASSSERRARVSCEEGLCLVDSVDFAFYPSTTKGGLRALPDSRDLVSSLAISFPRTLYRLRAHYLNTLMVVVVIVSGGSLIHMRLWQGYIGEKDGDEGIPWLTGE